MGEVNGGGGEEKGVAVEEARVLRGEASKAMQS